MNDPPVLPPSHLAPSRRQLRSTSQSPTRQRPTDDLISHLSPRTAFEAFRNPSGALKACMDAATPTEQAFAVRTAVASKKIHEWLEELLTWPWPAGGGSAGFETPPAKRRKLSYPAEDDLAELDDAEDAPVSRRRAFMGSLLATDVIRFESRIDDIYNDMEEIDVEGIKTHVLHNHIMPLSRPGTPMSESNRSITSSISSYTRMDDLTALITATIVQALPNLSKLTRLMSVWNIRLLVLRKSAVFLTSLTDAEVALESGWNTIELATSRSAEGDGADLAEACTLSRKDFEIMRQVLEKKVSKPGRDLDCMLDALEGREETLPDEWIDRMDSVERRYAEWVATCERRVREAEWAKMVRENQVTRSPPASLETDDQVRDEVDKAEARSILLLPSEEATEARTSDDQGSGDDEGETVQHSGWENSSAVTASVSSKEPMPDPAIASTRSPGVLDHDYGDGISKSSEVVIRIHPAGGNAADVSHDPPLWQPNGKASLSDGTDNRGHSPEISTPPQTPSRLPRNVDLQSSTLHAGPPNADERGTLNGFGDIEPVSDGAAPEILSDLPAAHNVIPPIGGAGSRQSQDRESRVEAAPGLVEAREPLRQSEKNEEDPAEVDVAFDDILDFVPAASMAAEMPEPELPPLPSQTRRGSDGSEASTIVHGFQGGAGNFSSDLPDYGTPEPPRIRHLRLDDQAVGDDISPPSSPPAFRTSTRSPSVSFHDMPTVAEAPGDETPPKTPLDDPVMEDADLSRDIGSPSRMSEASADDQLQQQISEILESIPAKIRLTSEPAAINLNPPDFPLPRVRSRPDPTPRSHSSLSSRAGTPSFTLAPAYARNSRHRHQRGNQEIKLYHLSRSTGEAPIKLFIRLVGENGERVMVRVGGGWADLGEYLKEYATHHGRRSGGEGKVEIKDLPRVSVGKTGSSPPSRPASALDSNSPITPLNIRKTRKSVGEDASAKQPKTPLAAGTRSSDTPSSGTSTRSRSSSRLSWTEEDSSLGMAGPKAKNVEMSEESRAWVESVKEKVRIASGERKPSDPLAEGKFGDMGKVGGTKRLFRKGV